MKTYFTGMPGIRVQRKRRGYTMQQASDLAGVSRQSWCQWETGATIPLANVLPDVARVLGCSIDALFEAEKKEEEDDGIPFN